MQHKLNHNIPIFCSHCSYHNEVQSEISISAEGYMEMGHNEAIAFWPT
jgi:hypothetical protein